MDNCELLLSTLRNQKLDAEILDVNKATTQELKKGLKQNGYDKAVTILSDLETTAKKVHNVSAQVNMPLLRAVEDDETEIEDELALMQDAQKQRQEAQSNPLENSLKVQDEQQKDLERKHKELQRREMEIERELDVRNTKLKESSPQRESLQRETSQKIPISKKKSDKEELEEFRREYA